jgi:hypothetical protein
MFSWGSQQTRHCRAQNKPQRKTTMEKKLSAKDFLRSVFAGGGRYTMDQLLNGGMYKEVTMRTAITDLKNPKYSAGPVLFIENDGTHFFTREQNADAQLDEAVADHDEPEEEDVPLVDQIPDNMPVARGLAAWIEDGAGMVLGAFDASFDIDEEQDKLTASIELDGTPSTFSEGGRRLSVSTGTNEAVVEVETEVDGRSVRLFVEAIEQGFAHAFCYPVIEIPIARQLEALTLTNEINKASKLAHIYMIEIQKYLVPCIKASSISSGQSGSFENVSYAALDTTYRFWGDLMKLTADQEGSPQNQTKLQVNVPAENSTGLKADDAMINKAVSIENLKTFLDDASMDYVVDDDGDIYVTTGLHINTYISIFNESSVIKLFTYFDFRDGKKVDRVAALELANRINYNYYPNIVAVEEGRLYAFYFEMVSEGISKSRFLDVLRLSARSFVNAVGKQDLDNLI